MFFFKKTKQNKKTFPQALLDPDAKSEMLRAYEAGIRNLQITEATASRREDQEAIIEALTGRKSWGEKWWEQTEQESLNNRVRVIFAMQLSEAGGAKVLAAEKGSEGGGGAEQAQKATRALRTLTQRAQDLEGGFLNLRGVPFDKEPFVTFGEQLFRALPEFGRSPMDLARREAQGSELQESELKGLHLQDCALGKDMYLSALKLLVAALPGLQSLVMIHMFLSLVVLRAVTHIFHALREVGRVSFRVWAYRP